MNKKQILTPILILILLYISLTFPILYLTILLYGKADNVLVICFGIFNYIYLINYFKKNIVLSVILGFLSSSLSLCLIYVIWFFGIKTKSFFSLLLFILLSIGLTLAIKKFQQKILNLKNVEWILILPSIVILLFSFTLKDKYPIQSENENLKLIEIKIVDKMCNPKIGVSISVRIYRQPLFGLRESHEKFTTITNKNGVSKLKLSKSHNYQLTIISKVNKSHFFEIDSKELKTKSSFLIKE